MLNPRNLKMLLIAAGLALSSTIAVAQDTDLSGSWTMTMLGKSPTGENEVELTFERDGFNLMVTMTGKKGVVKSIGYIDGHEIRFYYIRPTKKEDFVAKFTGHVLGDLMGGEVDMGKQGITTWKATRGPEQGVDLSGIWTMQMRGDSPSGMHLVKVSFSQEDHNLIATFHGEKSDIECEGSIDGRVITFYYVRPTNGEQFVAKFTGQLAGALMGGEVDMGETGKTTWRATQDLE